MDKSILKKLAFSMIKTERLLLRPWQEGDLKSFALMNADPRVMEFFPSIKSYDESRKEYLTILNHFKKHGYGWWAVSESGKTNFIGFIGLRYIDFPSAFTPAVEVAWRLKFEHWGKGYATEGAKASLEYGFTILQLPEIVSFASTPNLKSRAVMGKIGMSRSPKDDFDHPKLPKDHRLSRNVFYRINYKQWRDLNECAQI